MRLDLLTVFFFYRPTMPTRKVPVSMVSVASWPEYPSHRLSVAAAFIKNYRYAGIPQIYLYINTGRPFVVQAYVLDNERPAGLQ
jgi:hypothetical protein